MRTVVILLALLGLARSAAAQESSAVRVYESHADAAITEGETTLSIEASTAYAAATDYQQWTSIFPDIARVVVTKQSGVDAFVTLIHADGNRDNVHFHNQPQRHTVWFEDTGGRAEVWAELVFAPGADAGTTRAHLRLYADVHGVASWFVSDRKLRGMRQQRVRHDLASLRTYFTASVATAR